MQGSCGKCLFCSSSRNLSLCCLWACRWEANVSWDESFARLLRWRDDVEGGRGVHCNLPEKLEYEGQNLGQWLHTQRRAKRGTSSTHTLSEQQEAQLQALVDAGQLW